MDFARIRRAVSGLFTPLDAGKFVLGTELDLEKGPVLLG